MHLAQSSGRCQTLPSSALPDRPAAPLSEAAILHPQIAPFKPLFCGVFAIFLADFFIVPKFELLRLIGRRLSSRHLHDRRRSEPPLSRSPHFSSTDPLSIFVSHASAVLPSGGHTALPADEAGGGCLRQDLMSFSSIGRLPVQFPFGKSAAPGCVR